MIGLVIFLFVLIAGGCWLRVAAGVSEPSLRTEVVHTPQPTIYISYGEPDVRLNLITSTETYRITHTPVPDFAATQRALDDAVREHKEAVSTQMAEAANVATATELAHQSRLNDTEYDGAVAVLSSKIQSLNYEDELHQQTISHTVELNAMRLSEEQRWLLWRDNIRLIAMGGAVLIVGLVAGILVVRFGIFMLVPEPEYYEPEPVRLELVTADKKRTLFRELSIDEDRLRVWAENALNGTSLSYNEWVTQLKYFTRPEYDKLTEFMHEIKYIEYVNNEPSQGQRVTKAGGAALRAWLRGE